MQKERQKVYLIIGWLLLSAVPLFSQVSLTPGVTRALQAEDAVFSEAAVESEHSGFTGSGYVNFINAPGGYIEWSVNVDAGAEADCRLIYANGGADRGMEVRVNGNLSLAEYLFPATGGWTSWAAADLVLGLQGGINTIRLISTDSEGGPNLDRLDITLRQPGPGGSPGDVNGDGDLNIVDALMTAQSYVGLNPPGFIPGNADINSDGSITIVDALIIAQIYVGLVTPPPTSTPTPTVVTPTPTSVPTTPPPAGDIIYASPAGSSGNGGTSFSDALDLATGLGRVSAGQTLLLQAGTYRISYSSGSRNTIFLTRSGDASRPVRVEGYNGQAVLDFQCPDGDWVQDSWGFELSGNYWYFKNLDITRAAYQGVYVMGSHNTFEECNFYNNRNTGLEINEGGAYTTVINCDAYDNYDPKKNGGMADGFAAKQQQGTGNVFIGCDAWGNSDDGYDNYDSTYTVIYEDCTANSNGTHDGNGNGFKLGGNDVIAHHELTNCIANNNRQHGFHANSNPGPIYLTGCSAAGNGGNDFNGEFLFQ